jgi:hypothetical protein
MQVSGYDLPRMHLLGHWVNKGKKKGRSYDDPAPITTMQSASVQASAQVYLFSFTAHWGFAFTV